MPKFEQDLKHEQHEPKRTDQTVIPAQCFQSPDQLVNYLNNGNKHPPKNDAGLDAEQRMHIEAIEEYLTENGLVEHVD